MAPKNVTDVEQPVEETPELIAAELDKVVDNLVKSKKLAVTGVVGKASLFDIATHSPLDYTVGGKLAHRWCNENDANIAAKRLQGYMFPEEISPRLKNLRQGGQVLMLRHIDAANSARQQLEQETRRWEGRSFDRSDKAKAPGLEGFKIERPERR